MSNLYSQAESNVRKTWIYLFFLGLLIFAVGAVISFFFGNYNILWLALFVAIIVNIFSYWHSDKIVLNLSKAKKIEKKDNPELYRIVENLSITAGLPMPKVYIIESEQPNAFATGRNPEHGVVVVTRGLLDKLERVEIEAVIAHELAHIGNRDVLLSTVVVVLVGMVILMTEGFFRISAYRGSALARILMIIISLLLMLVAQLLAKMMKAAISRKREFLADASGVLLTRYPQGLARALEKISQDPAPMKSASEATSHLYIVSPFKGKEVNSKFHKLFATHPPIQDRIAKLKEMSF